MGGRGGSSGKGSSGGGAVASESKKPKQPLTPSGLKQYFKEQKSDEFVLTKGDLAGNVHYMDLSITARNNGYTVEHAMGYGQQAYKFKKKPKNAYKSRPG